MQRLPCDMERIQIIAYKTANKIDYSSESLCFLDFSNLDLSELDLSAFREMSFVSFANTNLTGANLSGLTIDIKYCDFKNAKLNNATLTKTTFIFSYRDVNRTLDKFDNVDLSNVDFFTVKLVLSGVDLDNHRKILGLFADRGAINTSYLTGKPNANSLSILSHGKPDQKSVCEMSFSHDPTRTNYIEKIDNTLKAFKNRMNDGIYKVNPPIGIDILIKNLDKKLKENIDFIEHIDLVLLKENAEKMIGDFFKCKNPEIIGIFSDITFRELLTKKQQMQLIIKTHINQLENEMKPDSKERFYKKLHQDRKQTKREALAKLNRYIDSSEHTDADIIQELSRLKADKNIVKGTFFQRTKTVLNELETVLKPKI